MKIFVNLFLKKWTMILLREAKIKLFFLLKKIIKPFLFAFLFFWKQRMNAVEEYFYFSFYYKIVLPYKSSTVVPKQAENEGWNRVDSCPHASSS